MPFSSVFYVSETLIISLESVRKNLPYICSKSKISPFILWTKSCSKIIKQLKHQAKIIEDKEKNKLAGQTTKTPHRSQDPQLNTE